MKVKYRLLNDLLLYEDECITYLEKMAQDGWYLVKVGTTFFKFERRSPRKVKYQMDYNLLTPDYLEMITLEGYRFVDNYREISFFYNEDINAANLHTDEAARLMALGLSLIHI